jgi:3-hydroxyisobutyrate dehydrogenase-like beta-hydroxyacid dehydrogenase
MKIGLIGLGSMGRPMAKRLARAGHTVTGWNRTPRRSLEADGFKVAESPAEACQAELLISMLTDSAAHEEVLVRDGRLVCAGVPRLIHVCMGTVSDECARRFAALHEAQGQVYVSAPVFGPPEAAQSGRLLIVAAGPQAVVDRIKPVLAALGRIDYLGEDPAMANIVKLAGNFLMASVVESLRDAMTLVHAAGADPRQFAGVLTQSLFPTPVYQYLGGLLAGRLVEGGEPVPNPFVTAAALSSVTARRLGVTVPLMNHIQGKD